MNEEIYLALAHIAGEVWGTQARAHLHRPVSPAGQDQPQPSRILGYDVYFEVLDRLKADFRKEVSGGDDTAEAPDGEDT